MSHVAEAKTVVTQVNEQVLQEAIEAIVRVSPELKVETHFKDYGNRNVKCDIALSSSKLPRGIGINFRKGGMTFIGDEYGHSSEYHRLQQLILQTYQVIATQKALAGLGYSVEAQSQAGNIVYVEGVRA